MRLGKYIFPNPTSITFAASLNIKDAVIFLFLSFLDFISIVLKKIVILTLHFLTVQPDRKIERLGNGWCGACVSLRLPVVTLIWSLLTPFSEVALEVPVLEEVCLPRSVQ